ncbi:MAG: hypothetical protein J5858_11650 [Lentisphaeria bacterium]|nr:hypothetical protein [Lentisphaeria bacterium]
MLVVYVALMIVGLAGIIFCKKKQKTNPNAQTIAIAFVVVVLAGAGGMLYETGTFGGDREMDRIIGNEIAFATARSKVLADYIGKTWNGETAVIITEPNIAQNKIAKAALDAMTANLKAAGITVSGVEALKLSGGNADEPVPMEVALTAKVYNEIFDRNSNVNLFIIMSQLPFEVKELKNLKCWNFDTKKKRIVLVNGEIYNLKGAIAQGIVGAAVAMKTGPNAYDPEKAAPKDTQAAFDTRFILVTPQNVKDIAAQNKDLFAK